MTKKTKIVDEVKKETFIDVLGYEGLYKVSNFGNIKSLGIDKAAKNGMRVFKPERVLSTRIDKDGYVICTIYKDGKRKDLKVHRVVLASFSGEWRKETVNHIDGVKTNNSPENLEWCTITANNRHALKTGLRKIKYGFESPRALPRDKVFKIKKLLETGERVCNIVRATGVSNASIHRIINKET